MVASQLATPLFLASKLWQRELLTEKFSSKAGNMAGSRQFHHIGAVMLILTAAL